MSIPWWSIPPPILFHPINIAPPHTNLTVKVHNMSQVNNIEPPPVNLFDYCGNVEEPNIPMLSSNNLIGANLFQSANVNKGNLDYNMAPLHTQNTTMMEIQNTKSDALPSQSEKPLEVVKCLVPVTSSFIKKKAVCYCKLCHVYYPNFKKDYIIHTQGKRHKKNKGFIKDPILEEGSYCEVCDFSYSSVDEYDAHWIIGLHRNPEENSPSYKQTLQSEKLEHHVTSTKATSPGTSIETSATSEQKTDKIDLSVGKEHPIPEKRRSDKSILTEQAKTSSYQDNQDHREQKYNFKSTKRQVKITPISRDKSSTNLSQDDQEYRHQNGDNKQRGRSKDSNRKRHESLKDKHQASCSTRDKSDSRTRHEHNKLRRRSREHHRKQNKSGDRNQRSSSLSRGRYNRSADRIPRSSSKPRRRSSEHHRRQNKSGDRDRRSSCSSHGRYNRSADRNRRSSSSSHGKHNNIMHKDVDEIRKEERDLYRTSHESHKKKGSNSLSSSRDIVENTNQNGNRSLNTCSSKLSMEQNKLHTVVDRQNSSSEDYLEVRNQNHKCEDEGLGKHPSGLTKKLEELNKINDSIYVPQGNQERGNQNKENVDRRVKNFQRKYKKSHKGSRTFLSLRDHCRSQLAYNVKVLKIRRNSISDEACDSKSIDSPEEQSKFQRQLGDLRELLDKRRRGVNKLTGSSEVENKLPSSSKSLNETKTSQSAPTAAPLNNSAHVKYCNRSPVNIPDSVHCVIQPNIVKSQNPSNGFEVNTVNSNPSYTSANSNKQVKSKEVPEEVSTLSVCEDANKSSNPASFKNSVKSYSDLQEESPINTFEDDSSSPTPPVQCDNLSKSNLPLKNMFELNTNPTNLSSNCNNWLKSNSVPKTKRNPFPMNTKNPDTKEYDEAKENIPLSVRIHSSEFQFENPNFFKQTKENLTLTDGQNSSESQYETPENFDKANENQLIESFNCSKTLDDLASKSNQQNVKFLTTLECPATTSSLSNFSPTISVMPVEKINTLNQASTNSAQVNEPNTEPDKTQQCLAVQLSDGPSTFTQENLTNMIQEPDSVSQAQKRRKPVRRVITPLMCSECQDWPPSDQVLWCQCRLVCLPCSERYTNGSCMSCNTMFEADTRLSNLHQRVAACIPHPCPNSPCKQNVLPRSSHLQICRFRPACCVKCHVYLPLAQLRDHLDQLHPREVLSETNEDVNFTEFIKTEGSVAINEMREIYCFTGGLYIAITLNKVGDQYSFIVNATDMIETIHNYRISVTFKYWFSVPEVSSPFFCNEDLAVTVTRNQLDNHLCVETVYLPLELYTKWVDNTLKLSITVKVCKINSQTKRRKIDESSPFPGNVAS